MVKVKNSDDTVSNVALGVDTGEAVLLLDVGFERLAVDVAAALFWVERFKFSAIESGLVEASILAIVGAGAGLTGSLVGSVDDATTDVVESAFVVDDKEEAEISDVVGMEAVEVVAEIEGFEVDSFDTLDTASGSLVDTFSCFLVTVFCLLDCPDLMVAAVATFGVAITEPFDLFGVEILSFDFSCTTFLG